MKWNNRSYRPGNYGITKNKKIVDINELLKPYKGDAPVWVPVQQVVANVYKESEEVILVTPTPTPSSTTIPITPTPTNTSTATPTPTPTPSAVPFTPSSLGNLQVWFDANDDTTITSTTDASYSYVTNWKSKGILNYAISAETNNRRPIYITTGNTGSSKAVLFQNTGTTRPVLYNRGTQNMNVSSGYTMFWAGKYVATSPLTGNYYNSSIPLPITMWNSAYTQLTSGEAITFGAQNLIDRQPISSGSTTVYNNQFDVNASTNPNLLDVSGRYVMNGLSWDYTQNIPTVQPKSTTLWEGNLIKLTNNTSGYTSNFSTQGKNLNSFGMMGYKLSASITQSSTQNQPWEIYEVLVYNKPLTESEFNQVDTYLRNKWGLSYSTTGKAVVNTTFTGVTFTGTNFEDIFVAKSGLTEYDWFSMWNNTNDKMILSAGTTYIVGVDKSSASASPNWTWNLYDSNNNFITGATCYDVFTGNSITINLSAGTYTMTGTTDYTCSPIASADTYLNDVVAAGGTGITSTVSAATRTLFTELYNNKLWDKIITMYPLLGGTANSTAISAKAPAGTDITWNGGVSYGASGATGNGVNAYGNTSVDLSTANGYAQNNLHYSIYVTRDGGGANTYDFGVHANTASDDRPYDLAARRSGDGQAKFDAGNFSARINYTTATSLGYLLGVRRGAADRELYKNGTSVGTSAVSSDDNIAIGSPYILAQNPGGGGTVFYTDNTIGFVTTGLALSDAEASTLSSIVNTFMTSIGRNAY